MPPSSVPPSPQWAAWEWMSLCVQAFACAYTTRARVSFYPTQALLYWTEGGAWRKMALPWQISAGNSDLGIRHQIPWSQNQDHASGHAPKKHSAGDAQYSESKRFRYIVNTNHSLSTECPPWEQDLRWAECVCTPEAGTCSVCLTQKTGLFQVHHPRLTTAVCIWWGFCF